MLLLIQIILCGFISIKKNQSDNVILIRFDTKHDLYYHPCMLFCFQYLSWPNTIALAVILLPLCVIDLKKRVIPDLIVLPSIAVLLIMQAVLDISRVPVALLHGAVAFAVIAAFWLLSKKKIGLGDAKLSFLIAAALGFFEWWIVLLCASIGALFIALILMRIKKMKKEDKIPLAPFFCFGVIIVILLKLTVFFDSMVCFF